MQRRIGKKVIAMACILGLMLANVMTINVKASVKDFSYETLGNGTLKITGYNGKAKKVKVPKKIKGKKVTVIGEHSFSGRRIKNLTIPEGVVKIEDMAFFDMQRLTKLSLPLSVNKITKECGIGYYSEASDFPQITISCVKGSIALKKVAKYFSHQKIKTRNSKKIMISFKGNGGKASIDTRIVKRKGKYGKLPIANRGGYKFTGWYTAKKGGKKVKAGSKIKKTTLYAHWKLVNKGTTTLHNPTYHEDDGSGTWDCIYFGNYYQTDTSGNRKEKIRWRVLSISGSIALLLTDDALDVKPFCEKNVFTAQGSKASWKTSTLRSWLNGYGSYATDNFISKAFTSSEKDALLGGDKVTLLTKKEVTNPMYGYNPDGNAGDTNWSRSCSFSDYAENILDNAENDSELEEEDRGYWLKADTASGVMDYIDDDGDVRLAKETCWGGVRPAVWVDLSKTKTWSKAKKVKRGK